MFENSRRGRQVRNFTTNVPKILDLKSSSEQIFSENWRWVPLILPFQDEGCPSYFLSQLGSEKTVLTAMIRTRRTALAPHERWQRLFKESMKWPWMRRKCREYMNRSPCLYSRWNCPSIMLKMYRSPCLTCNLTVSRFTEKLRLRCLLLMKSAGQPVYREAQFAVFSYHVNTWNLP